MTPVLRTDRLDFIPYRDEDEDYFVTLLRNEEVCHWMGQDLVSEAELRVLFRAIRDDVYPKEMFDVWGLWMDGEYAGHAEVEEEDRERRGLRAGRRAEPAVLAPGRGLGGGSRAVTARR